MGAVVTRVLAQCTVSDLERARAWYDRVFDRAPDAEPMAGLVEYHLGEGFGVQVYEEPERAGRSSVVLTESDLDGAVERLRAAGVTADGAGGISDGRALQLLDPDGNRVVFVGP